MRHKDRADTEQCLAEMLDQSSSILDTVDHVDRASSTIEALCIHTQRSLGKLAETVTLNLKAPDTHQQPKATAELRAQVDAHMQHASVFESKVMERPCFRSGQGIS